MKLETFVKDIDEARKLSQILQSWLENSYWPDGKEVESKELIKKVLIDVSWDIHDIENPN